jgi:hypothetical protein
VGFGLVQLLGFIMTDQPEMHSQPPSVQQPWIHQLAELLAIVVRPETVSRPNLVPCTHAVPCVCSPEQLR